MLTLNLLTAAGIALLAAPASAAVQQITMRLGYRTVSPDGVPVRMKLANGVPDYPIVINKGDTANITVINELDVPTSLHWHGIFQTATPWYDGAGQVTQCAIQPGETFVYTFDVGEQVGTYWWHAHYASQYVDGLRGPFIINDPDDPYQRQYDEDMTITLTDHYHQTAAALLDYYFSPNEGVFEPVPNSGLINSKGRFNCSNGVVVEPKCKPDNPLTKITFTPGKTYRLRLINTAAMAPFTFSIDGHNMTVIEADGVYTNPTTVNQIRILSSQRYSILVTASHTGRDTYWMRALIDTAMWLPAPIDRTGLDAEVKAIVRYSGARNHDPVTVPDANVVPLDAYTLGELNGLTELPVVDFNQIYFGFAIQANDANVTRASVTLSDSSDTINISDVQYEMPRYPTLLDAVAGNRLPASSNAIYVNLGQYVFLQVRNDDAVEHVFHLHGHTFWVVNSGHLLHAPIRREGQTFPRRDAIQVPPCVGGHGAGGEAGCTKGYVGLLIKFDHPGAWMFHCHIEWHMAAGLAFTFITDELGSLARRIPDSVYGSCGRRPTTRS